MLRKFILAVLLLMCYGCSERTEITPKIEKENQFSIKQAKDAFVRDYTAAIEARSETTRALEHIYYTLADTDYTPLWDKAKNTENDHVLSIDVPLYSVSGAFASDTDGENMRMATQKLIVIQSKKSGDTFSYLLTLCPDVACAEKYSDLNDVFTHLGDCSKFSGLAIYTSLAGELVAVDKFVNGTETGYVYVGNPEADQHALHHQAEHLMEYMKYYLSSGPVEMTRGGGLDDFIHENLCRKCMSYPCICEPVGIKCPKCNQWKDSEDSLCWCDYELICPNCGNSVCTCSKCDKCGMPDCAGCEGDKGEQEDNNSEVCTYCYTRCNRTCIVYCSTCHYLKSVCDDHYCEECGKVNNECTCY